jgi:transposase
MNKSKPYAAVAVNQVDLDPVLTARYGQAAVLGVDVAKDQFLAVLRWTDGHFERPWRVRNPDQIRPLVGLLLRLRPACPVRVALEPSGTYGDALRQALDDADLACWRVSPKAVHDYAEVFDGVPSQHDGKDAAVIAELAALNKSARLWPFEPPPLWQQELSYQVDWLTLHQRQGAMWCNRLEGLQARHWPEVGALLRPGSPTLLRLLEHYGGPGPLRDDEQALARLQRWGGRLLSVEKARAVLGSAAATQGVRMAALDLLRMRQYAQQVLQARQQKRSAAVQLRRLAGQDEGLARQAAVVGAVTACVLWAGLGDPGQYDSAAAYRKAMGLNLREASSGRYQGQLHLSKRGDARTRQWLYLAALRLLREPAVQAWYAARKQAKDNGRRLVVALMRKLALALYHVARGCVFSPGRLLGGAAACDGGGPVASGRG